MAEGRIFISYRRGADNAEARLLYSQLERFFDRERLFMDVDDIPIGRNFRKILDEQVAACHAFVAVIGRGWVEQAERLGERSDFVRIEIEAALKRPEIPIIPAFIDDVQFPGRRQVPDALHDLLDYNGVNLRHETYPNTIKDRLVPALSEAMHEETPAERRSAPAGFSEPPAVTRPEPDNRKLPEPGTIFRDVDEPSYPEMVVIPPGTFLMGSPENEPGRYSDEGPQHEVEIAQSFALARFATTFEEYDAFCDATDREKPGDEGWGRGRRPVIKVSWHDAVAYCGWLSERTGHEYRLPSEAEWEYACRAGTKTAYSFGDVISTDLANYDGKTNAGWFRKGDFRKKTVPVDFPGFKPNAFGLSQMHGNVREWCSDQFVGSYENPRRQTPFQTGSDDGPRVLRGGSWLNIPQVLRSAYRGSFAPGNRNGNIGFRPARTLLTP